jgi:hypothetical protein
MHHELGHAWNEQMNRRDQSVLNAAGWTNDQKATAALATQIEQGGLADGPVSAYVAGYKMSQVQDFGQKNLTEDGIRTAASASAPHLPPFQHETVADSLAFLLRDMKIVGGSAVVDHTRRLEQIHEFKARWPNVWHALNRYLTASRDIRYREHEVAGGDSMPLWSPY